MLWVIVVIYITFGGLLVWTLRRARVGWPAISMALLLSLVLSPVIVYLAVEFGGRLRQRFARWRNA
jgi:hypothetical protein